MGRHEPRDEGTALYAIHCVEFFKGLDPRPRAVVDPLALADLSERTFWIVDSIGSDALLDSSHALPAA
jgi:hypothetical protein